MALILILAFHCVGFGASTNSFVNPVAETGADPWVIQHGARYFYCLSRGGTGVFVSKAERLVDIGKSQPVSVWTPPKGKPWSKELWAPELHYLRGKWFIYVAADDGDNANHRMYVLEGTSQDPQSPFVFRGKLAAPTDRWAIDGTVLKLPDDRLYFIWSGWDGTNNVAQNLYIAPMSDPLTISGERVCISRPEHDWEKRGRPLVNEGPEALWHGDKLFIIYSASGSWGDDYCLGQLTWTGGDVLNPKSWVKKAAPVFSGTEQVISPGHASFVKSPDGGEDWIVYHTAKRRGSGWARQVQMQSFAWHSDGSPNFGVPVAKGVQIPLPRGDSTATILPPLTNAFSWSGVATNAWGNVLATITVNTAESPDLAAWGKRAGELCVEWYPKIALLLASEGFEPPSQVRLVFREHKDGVADTVDDTINIAADYVRQATNDFGMVIHELTHVVQSYRRGGNPGWLVEGVADYIRLTHFEPQAQRPRINPDRASYRDAYKTTASFLEWAEQMGHEQLVNKLNRAMRVGDFSLELFKTHTGKSVDELWKQFTDALRSKEKQASASLRFIPEEMYS